MESAHDTLGRQLLELPAELIFRILLKVSTNDLCAASLVCQTLCAYASDPLRTYLQFYMVHLMFRQLIVWSLQYPPSELKRLSYLSLNFRYLKHRFQSQPKKYLEFGRQLIFAAKNLILGRAPSLCIYLGSRIGRKIGTRECSRQDTDRRSGRRSSAHI